MRQPGAPRRSQRPIEQPLQQTQRDDWRQERRRTKEARPPSSPFGQQAQEKLSQFNRRRAPESTLIEQPLEP